MSWAKIEDFATEKADLEAKIRQTRCLVSCQAHQLPKFAQPARVHQTARKGLKVVQTKLSTRVEEHEANRIAFERGGQEADQTKSAVYELAAKQEQEIRENTKRASRDLERQKSFAKERRRLLGSANQRNGR